MSTVTLTYQEVDYLLTHHARVNPCEGVLELIPPGLFEKRLMYEPLTGCYALTSDGQYLIPQLEVWYSEIARTTLIPEDEPQKEFILPDRAAPWKSEGMRLLGPEGVHYYIPGDPASAQKLAETLNYLQGRSDRLRRVEDSLRLVMAVVSDGLEVASPNGSE